MLQAGFLTHGSPLFPPSRAFKKPSGLLEKAPQLQWRDPPGLTPGSLLPFAVPWQKHLKHSCYSDKYKSQKRNYFKASSVYHGQYALSSTIYSLDFL
jgi:hypothetical protein